MNFKRRYCLLAVFVSSVLLLVLSVASNWSTDGNGSQNATSVPSYVDEAELETQADRRPPRPGHEDSKQRWAAQEATGPSFAGRDCRMENCFDVSLCRQFGFRVYVYPDDAFSPATGKYAEILRVLRESRYNTEDPEQACLFVLAIDTLDRDRLSVNFVPDIQEQINALKYWRGGRNHLILNLYSGTWPDYNENGLGFDIGHAMLAKASISRVNYRSGFDISLPLFHKELGFRGGEPGALTGTSLATVRKYVLSFKGKRYLTGIGSETRNSLHHVHNGVDIILLTTCRHGKGWKNVEDERCETDNQEYDRWDYKALMRNSTFCLVPRGRRLGSYRFLESLQGACIPVLLSNDWVLPFSEVIDWNKAAVWADERLLLQVPNVVRSIGADSIVALRQQCHFLWETYFSSVDKIVSTTLEIVKDRIDAQLARTSFTWNTPPGSLAVVSEFSQFLPDFPFFWRHLGTDSASSFFTGVIYVRNRTSVVPSSPIYRLLKSLGRSMYLHKVIIVWHVDALLSSDVRWPVKVPVIHKVVQSVGERFSAFNEIETSAVLSLDDDSVLVTDEVDFAFAVWQNYPERIVGFEARNHFWDDVRQRWGYTSKWTNDYSMVLTTGAFYHKYYGYLYGIWLPQPLRQIVDQLQNCEDILFNFLVSHIVRHPPVKLALHRSYRDPPTFATALDSPPSPSLSPPSLPPDSEKSRSVGAERLAQRHFCIDQFVEMFGYVPLVRSETRFDPLLYKDQVSIFRKKYRQMETVI